MMILKTTIRATAHNLTPEAETAIAETARIFQSARRTAYQRLAEGQERDGIDLALRARFGMDARFARDAILEAQATRDGVRELLPRYIADTQAKIRKIERRLKQYREGTRRPRRIPLAQAISGLERRLAKLQAKRDEWLAHLDAGTPPPVIFGGAAAFHARRRGKMSHAEWQARRRAQFWSRGESPRGNQHARIKAEGFGFTISIATLPMEGGRLRYVSGDLWVPEKHRELLRRSLTDVYSVRVIRRDDKKGFDIHITVREKVAGEIVHQAPEEAIVGGLDCNADRLALAVASPQGNFLARHTIWMRDLPDARSDKATQIISDALDKALDLLEEQGASCLVVERLKFAQDHDTHRRFNRRTTRFRSTMVRLAVRKALRRGLAVIKVNPAYSSVIGKHKYAEAYGMSVHEAAAFVLARRGQGRDERLPKRIVAQLPQLREQLITAAEAKPAGDKVRYVYLKWADELSTWKEQHHWSLWSIWDKASGLKKQLISKPGFFAGVSCGRY